MAVFLLACGRLDLIVRAPGRTGEREVIVSCLQVPPECQVRVEVTEGGRRQRIYQGHGDFTIGLVEAAWAPKDESVDLFVCDRQGDSVILRYDFQRRQTQMLPVASTEIESVLRNRYPHRPASPVDKSGVPVWACSDGDSGANEFLEKIGKSRELVSR